MTKLTPVTHTLHTLQEKACEAFEVFDEMLECEVIIITPHIKATIEFCLEVISVITGNEMI